MNNFIFIFNIIDRIIIKLYMSYRSIMFLMRSIYRLQYNISYGDFQKKMI